MLKNIIWTEDLIKNISDTPGELLPKEEPEYLCALSKVGAKEVQTLTPESAHHIAQLHPIIVWSKERYCICGRRTFHLIANRIPGDETIPIGILPDKTTEEELKQIIYADTLLGMLAFAVRDPVRSLFQFSRLSTKKFRKSLSPALADSVYTCAKLLGVSSPTLYKKPEKT